MKKNAATLLALWSIGSGALALAGCGDSGTGGGGSLNDGGSGGAVSDGGGGEGGGSGGEPSVGGSGGQGGSPEPACGDENLDAGEDCDDGNLTDDDGCDSNCTVTGCGNGVTTSGEACDDGNDVNGDDCDTNCTVPGCGNGIVRGSEACDDGNLADDDGCDSNCTLTACGNDIVTAGEDCDDGNLTDGDGCDSNCSLTGCGNGIVSAGEECDDGNLDPDDGCSASCFLSTGESCDRALSAADAVSVSPLTWQLSSANAGAIDGDFACDASGSGPDAVIHYVKTSADLAGGGQLLHVAASSSTTATANYINVQIVSSGCDIASGVEEKCLWYKRDWDSYLDVPAGDYYIWVAKNSTGTFADATVIIDEVPASAAEGEGCFLPYSTASAVYTPPVSPGAPHTWSLPPSINSFDMGVTWGEPGSISCDDTAPYGDIHGVDAVLAFDKTSAASILQVEVQNNGTGTSDLDVEVLDVCDPNTLNKTSLACGANSDSLQLFAGGDAGTVYIWVATEATSEPFSGATVQVTELFPALGESWTTAEPLAGSGPITPSSTQRLAPPSCFPASGNIHWYSYVPAFNALSVRADVAGPVALLDGNGVELGCSNDASALPVGGFGAAGQPMYIAVLTAGSVAALTLTEIDYTGNLGLATDLGVTWPSSSTTDYSMAMGGGLIYLGGSSKVFSFPESGGVLADEHGSADGILAANLGYSLSYAQGALFSADETTTVGNARIYRIFDGVTWGPTVWDAPPPYPATSPMYSTAFDGASLLYASKNTTKVDFYSISPITPGAPVALGTNIGVGNVVGLTADSQYLYVAGVGRNGEGEGVFRIPRSAVTGPATQIAAIDTSTTKNNLFVDDDVAPRALYVRAYGGDVHVIAEPDQPTATQLGVISSLGTTADYAMTFDPSTQLIYLYETETNASGNVIELQ